MNYRRQGKPFQLWRELGELMTKDCTVIRYNKDLEQPTPRCSNAGAFPKVNLCDPAVGEHQLVFTRQLYNMLQLARVSHRRAMRDESRGPTTSPTSPIATIRTS